MKKKFLFHRKKNFILPDFLSSKTRLNTDGSSSASFRKKNSQPRLHLKILSLAFLMSMLLPCLSKKHDHPTEFIFFSMPEAQAAKKEKKKEKKTQTDEATENHLSVKRQGKVLSYSFEVPKSIKPAVDFWKMVYTQYDRNYEIFHDTENLAVIYSVMDFTDLYNNDALTKEERRALFYPRLEEEEQRIKTLLLSLHAKQNQPEQLSKEEKRIYDLFKDDPNPNKFLEASSSERIRSQTGIRNKFLDALKTSGAYLEEFENIFMSQGVPLELTRLAFVESMFNTQAVSKVGASGVWQFMPTTGRLHGLEINSVVDERNDPFRAAYAAADLLKSNYEALGSWPLAINAYNSGRATMSRAVSTLGTTDIGQIILYYRGGVYGFASRNFYPSFLAALEVSSNYPKYFGKVERRQKLEYDTYTLPSPMLLSDLVQNFNYSWEEILQLNPHFSEAVQNNQMRIPSGYGIKVPKGSSSKVTRIESSPKTQNTTSSSSDL